MRRSAQPIMDELDDLEDKSWKRKSYALAQHNALPIPMPHPVYPPPNPCPPPVVIRPSRLRSRPPGYTHPPGYQPAVRHNYYPRPPPPPLERLPTLSETNTGTPDHWPVRKVPPPPREHPKTSPSPPRHDIASSPPQFTTFRAPPPAQPSPSPPNASPSPRPAAINTTSQTTPVPQPRSNDDIPASPSRKRPIPPPPQRHINTHVLPQDSATPGHDTHHPSLTTFTSQPAPPSTTTYLPQQAHSSPHTPPLVPKTAPSLPSRPPPRLVQPRRSKTDQTMPSPHNKMMPLSPRPKDAPPAVPSPIKQSQATPESQESLPSSPRHPKSLDKPVIPSKPVDVGPTSTLLSAAEQDSPRIYSPSEKPLGADLDKQLPKRNDSDLNSFPVKPELPTVGIDCVPEDYNNSTSKISKVSESPFIEENFTPSPSAGVRSPIEDSNSTPQIDKNIPESPNAESRSTTSPLPEYKTDPGAPLLPLTPSSQSRSSSLASIGCPRTPTSIRAAPSWQPLFPATPLTKRSRSSSASNSESSLSPGSSNATPCPTTAPGRHNPSFLPTPPSSPSQTRVTPASSISSLPQGHGQNLRSDEEKQSEVEDIPDPASADTTPPHAPPAITTPPHTPPAMTTPPHPPPAVTTPPHAPPAMTATVNNTAPPMDELGTAPAKALPAPEAFQTYQTRFWVLTVFSFIAFLQTIVWGTFGPIAESAQAAFPSWNEATIAAFPNWGPIIVVVFIFPMVWLSQKLGLHIAMIICELFLTVGTMLRCFTSQEEVFTVMCHVSSVLFAFAACFTLALPAMVAATWFPPNERITATAVGTLMCQLGGAAMYLGALVVRYPSSDKAHLTDMERQDIRGDIMILMYIHFGVAVLLLVAVCVYFPARPPTPPSASSTEQRIDYFKAIKTLFKKLQLCMVLLVFAFSFGVPVVWIAVLNLSLKDIGIHQEAAMGVAVTAVVCSSATAFIAARVTDKMYGHLKVTVIVFLSISAVFFLWFLLLTTQVITPTLGQVYAAVAGGLAFEYATVPLLVELAVEIGFPIPESVTGATLTFVFNLVSLVFLGLFQIPNEGHLWVSCVLLACVSLSIIPLLFVKETHKRSDTDRKFM